MNPRTTVPGGLIPRPKRAWAYVAILATALSTFAAAIVVANVLAHAPREADENASAHLFQLAMAAQLPLLLLFLTIADWTKRRRVLLLLSLQVAALAFAFLALAWSGY